MNVLEAIVLPVTTHEIDSQLFVRFVRQLRRLDSNDLTLIFMIDKIGHKLDILPIINDLSVVFKNVEIAYANILDHNNIYYREETLPPGLNIPQYGLASGPNLLFFACMDLCKRFNTTLLLELDCFFKPNFIETLQLYCKHSGGFLISGSSYDGISLYSYTSPDFHHINGVALYKTGDPLFHYLIEQLQTFIIETVKEHPMLPYDVAITRMIYRNIILERTRGEWKRLYKQILKTPFIVNLSPARDADTEDIIDHYPSAMIIHKKFTDKDVHSLRGFLVQD